MLSRLSVKKPMTVFVCVVLVLILGVMSFINMTTDLLPNMDLPYAIAYTTYIGASPEQVEQSVTKTLESALATTSGVKNITSISQENVSIVVLEFEEGTGMDSAMIEMNASLDQIADSLPEAAGSPVLMKINPDMLPIMVLAVDSDNMAREELSQFTSSTVIPALERVDGVASVSGSGLVESQIRVELDQAKIDELNDKVLAAIDSSLADAEKQLKDSRRQINDAKKKLEEQSGTAYAQLVAAAQQLADAKDQASLGSTLTSAEVKAIQAVLAQYDNMVNLRDSYNASEDYARTHLSAVKYAELQSLQLTRTQLRAQLRAAQASLETAEAALKEIGSSEAALQQDVTNAKDAQEAAQTAYKEARDGAPERLKDDPGWQDLLRQEQEKQAEVDDLQAQLEKDPDNTGLQAQLNTAEAELAAHAPKSGNASMTLPHSEDRPPRMPSPSAGKTPRAVSPKFRNSPIPASSAPERSPEKIAAASPPRSRKPSMIPCKAIPIAAPMPENRPDTTSAATPNAEASRSAVPETTAPAKPIAEETAGPTAPAMADPAPVTKFTALSKADATAPTAARTPDATASQTPRRNALTAPQLSMTTTASVTAAPMARR